jgi:ribosomal biogenesis protein LAS1
MIPNKISISLWSPLLHHIQASHPDFPLVFCRCFVSLLTGTKSVERDLSYDAYIACWVMWAVETWQAASSGYFNLRREVLSHLLRELGCYPSHRVPTYGYWLLSKGPLLMF